MNERIGGWRRFVGADLIRMGYKTPWYMGRAYYDHWRDGVLCYPVPLHLAVRLIWWLNWKWCGWRLKPSWIDRMVEKAAYEARQRARAEWGREFFEALRSIRATDLEERP